jgi:ankyrin repeat protein
MNTAELGANARGLLTDQTVIVHGTGTIRLFLDRGADPLERQGEGDAALHEAAASGDMEMVKLLLERGSDVNARDDDGKSALDLAVERKHEEVADYLRTKGAK